MRRREFVTLLGGIAAALPLALRAQQPRRVGVLMGLGEDDPQTKSHLAAFREALRPLGWIDGQAIQIEHRAASDLDGLRSAAAELLNHAPDLNGDLSNSSDKCRPGSICEHADRIHWRF